MDYFGNPTVIFQKFFRNSLNPGKFFKYVSDNSLKFIPLENLHGCSWNLSKHFSNVYSDFFIEIYFFKKTGNCNGNFLPNFFKKFLGLCTLMSPWNFLRKTYKNYILRYFSRNLSKIISRDSLRNLNWHFLSRFFMYSSMNFFKKCCFLFQQELSSESQRSSGDFFCNNERLLQHFDNHFFLKTGFLWANAFL